MPGQRHDIIGVPELIEGHKFDTLPADKAFDANWLFDELDRRGADAVIARKSNRLEPRKFDKEIYKWRRLVENFFCKLKDFKRIAMRACKTDTSFSAMIYICSAAINSR